MRPGIHGAGRTALLVTAIGLCPWLGGCAEPALVVVVSLPDEIKRQGLTVELSVFTPTDDSDVDCDQIAYGDVRLPELRAARVFHQRLLAPEEQAQTVESQATSVDRTGTKIALALGAYDFEGSEIGDLEAVLAGCVEVGEVEGDTRVELRTGPTATVRVERPADLSLSAVLDDQGSTEVLVELRGTGGALEPQPEGLAVSLEDHLGRAISGSARFMVIDGGGDVRFSRTVGRSSTLASTLQIDRAGIFAVDVRARFQRGAFSPLSGLAYHQLLDSDADSGLTDLLERAAWARPAVLSAPDRGEWVGFLATPPSAVPERFDLVLARVNTDLSATVEPLLIGQGGGPPSLLGFIEAALPKPTRMAQIAIGPVVGSPDPFEQQAHLMLLPTPPPAPSHMLPSGLMPSGTGVGLGPCELGDESLPLLLGLGQVSASGTTMGLPIGHYQRVQLNGPPPSLGLLDEHVDLADGPLIAPAPVALTQSLCVDDRDGQPWRLLGAHDGRAAIFILLTGERIAELSDIGTAAAAEGSYARILRVEGQVQQGSVLSHQDGDRRTLLAVVWINDQLEVNRYTLDNIGPDKALGFDANLFRVPMPVPPLAARLVVGDLLRSPDEAPGQEELALLVVVISSSNTLAGQLYVSPLGPGPHMGQSALRITPASCVPDMEACRSLARDSDLAASDLDGDGYDELLLVTKEGAPSHLRAQVIGFQP